MKLIVEFNLDCGRMGNLSSTFVCDKEDLESLYDEEVYFGEVLGKHSEVVATLDESNFTIKSDDQEFINKFSEIMGDYWSTGHNPLWHYEEDSPCDDCGNINIDCECEEE